MLGLRQNSNFRPVSDVSIKIEYNVISLRLPMLVVVVIIQKREIILMDDRSIVMDCFWNLIEVRKFWIQRCSSLIGIRTINILFDSRS